MAFITKDDLKRTIRPELVDQIIREDETIVTGCISSAIQEMKSYLNTRFDTNTIFSLTGEDRDELLVSLACDITVYLLVGVIPAGIDLEDRRARYKRAITWLKDVRDGQTVADLPGLFDADQNPTTNPVEYGSNVKRDNYM